LTQPVDLLLTGELSHHEVLAAVAKGQHVILLGHANSERWYLSVLRTKLLALFGESPLEVEISKEDKSPLQIV